MSRFCHTVYVSVFKNLNEIREKFKNYFCFENCSYDIMLSCWNETPESRPLFNQLAEELSNMLDQNVSEHYISLNEPYSKENETRSSSADYLKLIKSPQNNLTQEISNRATTNDTTFYSLNEIHTNSQLSPLDNSIQIHQSTDC